MDVSRRSFLVGALSLSGALAAVGLASPIIRFAYPTVRGEVAARVRVASTAELRPLVGVIDFEYQEVPCSLLQLEDGTYRALSRVCTHLGCIISWRPEERDFFCPCHAGVFSPEGEVLAGPPPRPLPPLALETVGDEIWVLGWLPG